MRCVGTSQPTAGLTIWAATLMLVFPILFPTAGMAANRQLHVSPANVQLTAPEARQQLVVSSISGESRQDLTRQVKYASSAPNIATVTSDGRILPKADGEATISIRWNSQATSVRVRVDGMASPRPVSFRHEVLPILTKAGCNSGGCHGKAEGQNGFKLSIFGFDAEADHAALVKEGRGRRLSLAAPAQSLLLTKATAETPHGGGAKIETNSPWHQRLSRWIAEGAQLDEETAPHVVAIEVEPPEALLAPNTQQQIRVTAIDSTGARRCVTDEAEYQSNADAIATADRGGRIRVGATPGEAAILVRFMGQVGVCRITLPRGGAQEARPPENNFIDKHVWNKLQRLGIPPSEQANDATFLRRAYLDTIGVLPTVAEARRFLGDQSPDKRAKLVDQLLARDEYSDYWAMRWADILRVDKSIVTPQGAVAMTRWLKQQFAENTPYDQFAQQVVTARGLTTKQGPAAFYQVHKDAESAGRSISQIFLGVRIECAQCHHHPFEKWGQQDYFAFAGFFTGVSLKNSPRGGKKLVAGSGPDLTHPRTKQPVAAAGLGAAPAVFDATSDRRRALAAWLTSPENPYFARMIANRLWAHYFGRGLVEPIDDMRETNPATNEPLLKALAEFLVTNNYDLKALTREMLTSRTYQLSSRRNVDNESDEQNFSHATWKALPAEVLLDAMCQSTAIHEQFNGWPEGYRAVQIWDNRMPSYFFRVFGRPQRVTVCECERGNEPSIAQSLHLMNSPETVRKIRHRDGRAARLALSARDPAAIIEELYLATLSRFPSEKEQALMKSAFAESPEDKRAAVEDVLWTLLNTKEFIYNH